MFKTCRDHKRFVTGKDKCIKLQVANYGHDTSWPPHLFEIRRLGTYYRDGIYFIPARDILNQIFENISFLIRYVEFFQIRQIFFPKRLFLMMSFLLVIDFIYLINRRMAIRKYAKHFLPYKPTFCQVMIIDIFRRFCFSAIQLA